VVFPRTRGDSFEERHGPTKFLSSRFPLRRHEGVFPYPLPNYAEELPVALSGIYFVSSSGVAAMPQGTIKKLVTDKGFGFIAGERGDIFFHYSSIEGARIEELREGQRVEYTEGSGPKGPRADHVKPL
jgi:CspA family cold shock protein